MAQIEMKNVTKIYDNKNKVIEALDLRIENGSFTVLVGPSGCGKTTALRMIAGLEEVTSGQIFIEERDVTMLHPGKRNVAFVFQNYAIYPHMTVGENISFGLENAGVDRKERAKIINDVLLTVGLEDYRDINPSKLSGGQRQRVALARAVSKKPKVFLMDEPLSNLDAKLRNQMRTELIELHQKLGSTFVFVTHDQIEAMTMGQALVIMNKGKIMQKGSPREVYNNPNCIFTAQFIGDPGMNVYRFDEKAYFGFRPRKAFFERGTFPKEECIELRGRIVTREILGTDTLYCVETSFGRAMIKSDRDDLNPQSGCYIHIPKVSFYFFDASENRITSTLEIQNLTHQMEQLYDWH